MAADQLSGAACDLGVIHELETHRSCGLVDVGSSASKGVGKSGAVEEKTWLS